MSRPAPTPSGYRSLPFLSVAAPFVGAATAAMRAQFGLGLTICLVSAIVLSPVWVSALRHYRFARSGMLLAAVAVGYGALITVLDVSRTASSSLLTSQTLMILSFIGSIGMLLWARSVIGSAWTVVAFGLGGLANVLIMGGDDVNLWKFALAIPVTMVLLGLAMVRRSRVFEIISLVGVAAISTVSDSRSMTSFLLLTVVIAGWQAASAGTGRLRPRPWQTILGLIGLGVSAFLMIQALILDGVLGEAAEARTQAQIDRTGSLLAGGRPEMGASFSLLSAQPWGYGSGIQPTSMDIWHAKSGMSALNYDPNNGYVERYMFGGHFEVHSVLGDLWILFGPIAAALLLAMLALAVYSTARSISLRTASAALIFLTVLGAWDTFFSPLLTSYPTLALMVALAAVPAGTRPKAKDESPTVPPRL